MAALSLILKTGRSIRDPRCARCWSRRSGSATGLKKRLVGSLCSTLSPVALPFTFDHTYASRSRHGKAVVAVLDALNDTLRRRDLKAVLALFVPDADVTLVGSEAGETATGPLELRAFFERIFARSGTFSFEWRSCAVSARGDVAWFFADAAARYTEHDHATTVSYRTTGILERREDRWLFVQYHGSEPVGS